MSRREYSYPLWMPARKDTTPGSGELPISTLWTTLPNELVDQVLEVSQADHFDLHMGATGSPKSEETYTLTTDQVEEWDRLFTLLRLTKDTRIRALRRFQDKATVHVDTLQDYREPRFGNLSILSSCPNIIVEVVLNLTGSSFDWPTPARVESDLRLTLSMRIARPGEQQEPSKSVWELRHSEPLSHELSALRKCMRKMNAYIHRHQWWVMQSIASVSNESEHADVYQAWRTLRSLLDTESCYRLAREVVSGFVRYRHDTSLKATNDKQLVELEEEAVRKEILKVLPVFLPYFQPEDVSAVERVVALQQGGNDDSPWERQ